MLSALGIFLCILLMLWLYIRDQKLRPAASWHLWIPWLWITIIGTRPVSTWLGHGAQMESPELYLEGSPIDRNIFLFLIILGVIVLWRRRPDWGNIFDSNRWFFVLLIYWGISVIWSDYPFVSFKRWTKELGNVIMALIILTDEDPIQSIRAVFARFAFIAIPLSVILVIFFPDIGRYYDNTALDYFYSGVTSNKNELGITIFICSLFLFWELVRMRFADDDTDKTDLLGHGLLLAMAVWLIIEAQSMTAIVSIALGAGILLFMKLPFARRQARFLGTYSLIFGLLAIFLYFATGILGALVGFLNRDTTFSGRTDLWATLLWEPVNPLLGAGYQGFWLGPRVDKLWSEFFFHPNQAHNGYLDTYLNGGLVGVGLLLATIVFTGRKLKKEMLNDSSFGVLLFSFLVMVVLYNWTEAMFAGLNLLWFMFIISALYVPGSDEFSAEEVTPDGANP